MFKTIVVGVDGRDGGRDALSLAARLAGAGEIVAVRAFPFEALPARFGAAAYVAIATEEAQTALDRELAASPVAVARTRVLGGTSPARVLHRVAESEGADLIVVGSSHHGAVGRVLVGDAAANTLHASPCPVAIAPRGAAEGQPALRTIGVGVDDRDEARRALALAAALAQSCEASLRALSVVTIPPALAGTPGFDTAWIDTYREQTTEHLRDALARLDGIHARGEAAVGDPLVELTMLSREVDLLVLGSRAWGPVRRVLVGSTAARLTRAAHCPLLVLPRGAASGADGVPGANGADGHLVAAAEPAV